MIAQSNRRTLLTGIIASAFVAAVPKNAIAETVKRFSTEDDTLTALRGYDPVGYFSNSKAIGGSVQNSVPWKGVNCQFPSASDAEKFRIDPEAYAPQFGGYCTRAMSLGSIVPADPEVWRIHESKLYVFFAAPGGEFFDEAPQEMIAKAEAYWRTLDLVE